MKPYMPLALGLLLCEDVLPDPNTQNVSTIRIFSGMGVDSFPCRVRPFCAFAALTNGGGPTRIELLITEMNKEPETIPYGSYLVNFTDRLQLVNLVIRLGNCVFPRPGIYLFTLRADGEWLAQRSLRVYPTGEAS